MQSLQNNTKIIFYCIMSSAVINKLNVNVHNKSKFRFIDIF